MQSFPQPLSAAQEASYLRQYQNGDMHARDILIERNLRLVAHIVKKYIHSGKETDELISIGIIGLVKAVNTYNFDKGSRLATYAARCIDNELLMLMRGDKKRSREVSLYDPIGTDKEGCCRTAGPQTVSSKTVKDHLRGSHSQGILCRYPALWTLRSL